MEKGIWQRQKEREREAAKEEWQELLLEDKRLDALDMLEEMKKARGEQPPYYLGEYLIKEK